MGGALAEARAPFRIVLEAQGCWLRDQHGEAKEKEIGKEAFCRRGTLRTWDEERSPYFFGIVSFRSSQSLGRRKLPWYIVVLRTRFPAETMLPALGKCFP
jgi:hypothetical protein